MQKKIYCILYFDKSFHCLVNLSSEFSYAFHLLLVLVVGDDAVGLRLILCCLRLFQGGFCHFMLSCRITLVVLNIIGDATTQRVAAVDK